MLGYKEGKEGCKRELHLLSEGHLVESDTYRLRSMEKEQIVLTKTRTP